MDFIRRIKADPATSHHEIVMLSTVGRHVDMAATMSAGVRECVSKPIRAPRLLPAAEAAKLLRALPGAADREDVVLALAFNGDARAREEFKDAMCDVLVQRGYPRESIEAECKRVFSLLQ